MSREPIPSYDLAVSLNFVCVAKRAFAEQVGVDVRYETSRFTAGEFTLIHEAGDKTVAGFLAATAFIMCKTTISAASLLSRHGRSLPGVKRFFNRCHEFREHSWAVKP
jgi:hypothetical protein